MTFDGHANLAYGTVLIAPSPATTGTTLTLNSGQGALLPTPPFNAVVWSAGAQATSSTAEIVRVTRVSGDAVTITRGPQAGDPGGITRSILVSDQFAAAVTTKILDDIETAISELPTAGTDGILGSSGGTPVKAAVAAWYPHASNPLWPNTTFSGVSIESGAFSDFWYDGSEWHVYTMVDGSTPGIYHGTSRTGLPGSFTFDASPALTVSGSGWDSLTVGVPCVFKDPSANTLHMYYRGTASGTGPQIGHATASSLTPGGPWTKDVSNPVVTGSGFPGGSYVTNVECGGGRVILVNGTYYMWVSIVNTTGNVERQATVVTSSSASGPWTLLTGTYGTSQSIFHNGRFCNSIWTDGGLFYSLCPHYRQGHGSAVDVSELELWVSSGPTFQPGDRRCIGTIREPSALLPSWETNNMDVPVVPCDDVTRSSFNCTGGRPIVYYSGQNSGGQWTTGLMLPPSQTYLPTTPSRPLTLLGPWNTTTLTASQTNVQMVLLGGGLSYIALPMSCSVVGITVNLGATGHITAGSITAALTKATTQAGFARVLSTTLSTSGAGFNSARAQEGEFTFNPGDLIGVQITTNSSFAATATNCDVTVAVEPR